MLGFVSLVWSYATVGYCLQISDRLVTNGSEPWDPQSNKTVIFWGSDGLITISYCGPAYLGGIPTDNQIAAALTEGEAIRHRSSRMTGAGDEFDVGTAALLITDHLNTFPEFAAGGGELTVVGYQWNKKNGRNTRPLLWRVMKKEDGSLAVFNRLGRRPDPTKLNLTVIGDRRYLNESEFKAALGELGRAATIEDTVGTIVQATRGAAAKSGSTVGPDCLVVGIRAGDEAVTYGPVVRFLPSTAADAETGFSPWVILPGHTHPPSQLVGKFQVMSGGRSVTLLVPSLRMDRHWWA